MAAINDMRRRAYVIYGGDVQGVGFRYTARALASRYVIDGFVKNLTNGTVELAAQGDETTVTEFLDELKRRMAGHVRSADISWQPPGENLRGFTVRF